MPWKVLKFKRLMTRMYMLRFVLYAQHADMHIGSCVFLCLSKAEIMHKNSVVSRPKCYALSNGSLVFPVSSIVNAKNAG